MLSNDEQSTDDDSMNEGQSLDRNTYEEIYKKSLCRRVIAFIGDHLLVIELVAFIVAVVPQLNHEGTSAFTSGFAYRGNGTTTIDSNGLGDVVAILT